ncbi:hypothetical protein PBV87_12640 [Niameybacter massiliensis]|uniref:Uncharacterized protein n=1 Tax=Holtiella tumoricola TaxID=3018743 RepID=A0AA42J1F4_9FIRM|nr:hypothetical protein [Holtiella tumoricola]MDA3732335.1 hypothetical protein [Holtiella tumoricola]
MKDSGKWMYYEYGKALQKNKLSDVLGIPLTLMRKPMKHQEI